VLSRFVRVVEVGGRAEEGVMGVVEEVEGGAAGERMGGEVERMEEDCEGRLERGMVCDCVVVELEDVLLGV